MPARVSFCTLSMGTRGTWPPGRSRSSRTWRAALLGRKSEGDEGNQRGPALQYGASPEAPAAAEQDEPAGNHECAAVDSKGPAGGAVSGVVQYQSGGWAGGK